MSDLLKEVDEFLAVMEQPHQGPSMLRQCRDEIERLQTIVNRLPLTKDGVRVIPNQMVYGPDDLDCDSCEYLLVNGEWMVYLYPIGPELGRLRKVSECYSTKEAARAAKDH